MKRIWPMDKLKFCVLVLAPWITLVLSGAAGSLGATLPNVRMGYPSPSGAQIPVWVISEAKLDQRYGLNVQVIWISGVARLAQAMVSGDVDLSTSGGSAVNAILGGAELVYIAVGVPTYAFSIYVRADIKNISDLRGKVLGVLTKGASSDHAATAFLRHHGMRVGQDVKFVYLGGVREILAALDKGIIPAGVLSPPTTLAARRLGFRELINISSLGLPYVHNGIVTRRSLMRQKPDIFRGFLKAYVTAVKITREEPDVAKRALARFLATSDSGIIEEAYHAFGPLFPKVPYMTEEIIRSALSVSDNPRAAKADPKDFFDNSFLKELDESGFIKELYATR
jgi:ABC-type nitrate/sulfonate/bicarbonate transport system substrate-binding protein